LKHRYNASFRTKAKSYNKYWKGPNKYLRRPSGSNGASHHDGASDGSGPFRGELMLHCYSYPKKTDRSSC
jgi:hypothetical protein